MFGPRLLVRAKRIQGYRIDLTQRQIRAIRTTSASIDLKFQSHGCNTKLATPPELEEVRYRI